MGMNRIETIQRMLQHHRLWWHGGGTGVRAGCQGSCSWSAEAKTLNEAMVLHEQHAARRIHAILAEEGS